jgi:hypothetical protein
VAGNLSREEISSRTRPTGCGCAGKGVHHHGGSHSLEYANWHYLWRYHRERKCERWRDFKKFRADMGPKPKKLYVVGRLDRSKPYGPGNCKWMTRKQAQMGKRAKLYTFRGESLPMKDWAKRIGITLERLRQRMLKCRRYGVEISQALEAPAGEPMRCTLGRARRRMPSLGKLAGTPRRLGAAVRRADISYRPIDNPLNTVMISFR